jgi:hypothetical protein
MRPIEYYQSMEAQFRREAESESDLMIRERLLTQADGWNWLVRASRFIAQKQADTEEILAALDKKPASRAEVEDQRMPLQKSA